jgi:Flp pilus assembly protein TadG
MRPSTVRLVRNRRGQALVEFALILPMVLALVIGVFEFARAWNIQQVITDAAREAARIAVVANGNDETPAAIQTKVDNAINSALSTAAIDPATATITTSGLGAGRGENAVIGISVPYQFVFLSPLVTLLKKFAGGSGNGGLKSTIQLQTSFTMRNE